MKIHFIQTFPSSVYKRSKRRNLSAYIPQRTTCAAILSTDQEMILTRNATDAHAHELLLPILKPFAQCTCSLHTTRLLDVSTLRGAVEQSVAPTNSSPIVPPSQESPAPRQTRLRPYGDHFVICGLYWDNDKKSNQRTAPTQFVSDHESLSTGFSYCSTHCFYYDTLIFSHGATAPSGPGPPHYRCFTITLIHTTLGRTSLDEWSARRRDLYVTTQHSQKTAIHAPGENRTLKPSKRAAADPRLRPRGHWDRRHSHSFHNL
jgi:hypothetical protein